MLSTKLRNDFLPYTKSTIVIKHASLGRTESFGEEAGVRVVVHAPDMMPFPEDEGLSVSPGQMSLIAVRKVGRKY